MDTETCYRPPDRLLIVRSKPHRTRKNKKQKLLQFHIYIQPKTFYIYGFVIFAEVHARTSRGWGSGRYRWRVEKGLRRQQLAWEPLDRSTRGEGGRIDFINKLHNTHDLTATGPTKMRDRNGDEQQMKHICIFSVWQYSFLKARAV